MPSASLGTGSVNKMAATTCWPVAKIGLKSNISGGLVCVSVFSVIPTFVSKVSLHTDHLALLSHWLFR